MTGRSRNRLTHPQVAHAKPGSRLSDGGGLALEVSDTGKRKWTFRTTINGKRRELGCGGHDITLPQARARRDELAAQIAQGIDPTLAQSVRVSLSAHDALSPQSPLRDVAAHYVKRKSAEWSHDHAKDWLAPIELHCDWLMAMPVSSITLFNVMDALTPIWHSKTTTANRIQQRLAKVFKSQANSTHCLQFLILTAVRSQEARGARWGEFDREGGVWTIPAERMKARKAHTVPLSRQALALLAWREELAELWPDTDLVFPGQRAGKVMTDVAIAKQIRRYGGDCTIHGFRTSFRNFAAELPNHDALVAEKALAHQDKDKVQAAYLRTDMWDKRAVLMQQWANHVTNVKRIRRVV